MTAATVLYFASLREAANVSCEHVQTATATLGELYAELRDRHGFDLPSDNLRVAVDGEFASWGDPVREGAEIALLPPVSGG